MQLSTIHAKVRPKPTKIGGGSVRLVVTTCCYHDRQDKDVGANLAHVLDTGYFFCIYLMI